MTPAEHTVASAIADSIREDRIVTLTAKPDSQAWVDLVYSLSQLCRYYTIDRITGEKEFCGADDGDEWRVHLEAE